MGRMSPAAYDHWWRARIVREETDYANHILRNWQIQRSHAEASSNPTTQLTLNSLGAPQLIAPTRNFIQQRIAVKSSAAGSPTDGLLGRSNSVDKPPRGPGSPAASRPGTAAAAVHSTSSRAGSRAGSLSGVHKAAAGASSIGRVIDAGTVRSELAAKAPLAGDDADDKISLVSSTTGSAVSRASRATAGPTSHSIVSSAAKSSKAARSNVSYPQTPNFSQVGSSVATVEVMSRLARLEADLATERKKREAAEAEMRQLLTSRGHSKP